MGDKVLGIIPARSGSKGIPGKNTRLLAGRPLLEYTIRAARASKVIDRLILTTDSEQIATVGQQLGLEVPFLRPTELAQDETPMVPVLKHSILFLEQSGWSADIIVLLQPTAPLRRPKHIIDAVTLLCDTQCDSVASVVEVPRHFSPDYVMKIVDDKLMPFLPEGEFITRRQDTRPAYARDGTVYVVWREVLMRENSLYGSNCRPLILPRHESITLDTLEDWAVAEQRLMGKLDNEIFLQSS